jgi:hypothetical protein
MTEVLAYGTAVVVEPDTSPARAVALHCSWRGLMKMRRNPTPLVTFLVEPITFLVLSLSTFVVTLYQFRKVVS